MKSVMTTYRRVIIGWRWFIITDNRQVAKGWSLRHPSVSARVKSANAAAKLAAGWDTGVKR